MARMTVTAAVSPLPFAVVPCRKGRLSTIVFSSVDTKQRLSYNPHRTYPPKPPKMDTKPQLDTIPKPPPVNLSVSEPLKREIPPSGGSTRGKLDENEMTYLGHDVWLPSAPKVEKPRSTFNAASLAYIGDGIYELYARRHFLFPPLSIDVYNARVMAVVRCEAQDALLQKLITDDYLSVEERDVLRWGKNVGSAKTRSRKRAGAAVYNRASSLETLIGYLYLTNKERLDEIMLKLGFSAGFSDQSILKDADTFGALSEVLSNIVVSRSARTRRLQSQRGSGVSIFLQLS